MEENRDIVSHQVGHLLIYLTRGEKKPQTGWKRFFSRSLFQHIIDEAKRDGILNATAHSVHYGYTGRGKVQRDCPEGGSERLAILVELVSDREKLERFVQAQKALLKDKIIIFRPIEQWNLG
jgi:PII-like signaling protein